jgi:phage shock protein A
MSNPHVHAFFVGRTLAEGMNEALEKVLTNGLSELGKLDAEQRESWRQFAEEILARADQAEESVMQGRQTSTESGFSVLALQATIDELRAEIAQLRTELQRYRSRSV